MEQHKVPKRIKDKSDRATHDTVLDLKTVHIPKRLVERGMLTDVCGCISTGKEANVYKARVSPMLACKLISAQEDTNIARKNSIENSLDEISDELSENVEFRDNIESDESSEDESNCVDEVDNIDLVNKIVYNSINNETIINENDNRVITGTSCVKTNEIEDSLVPCAIKIYQTSIMGFKDRLKYIQSEPRYKIFCSSNPRKLVKLWAEKEVRNLKRLNKHNIPSPTPIYLKNNILIMTLIMFEGEDEENTKISESYNDSEATSVNKTEQITCNLYLEDFIPAPRLKDAQVEDYNHLYIQALQIIKDMYQKCNLVHADLSEYNLLVKNKTLIVIDVGQSVERSHDNAYEFLIMDIQNINRYWGCKIVSLNTIFEDVTGKHIPICMDGVELNRAVYVPDRLCEVVNDEDRKCYLKNNENELSSSQESSETDSDSGSADSNEKIKNDAISRDELKKIRKENKKSVKEDQREKRKDKVPKKEKRKREKLNKKRKKNQ